MNKLLVRAIALVLCGILVLGLVTTAFAAEEDADVIISSTEDFLAFAESCRLDSASQGKTYALNADIDLTGTDFAGIPIFCGTFNGNGHTVSGLSVTHAGSMQGLFRLLSADAVVRDLTVSGSVTPAGSRSQVGGIAGENRGTIENCTFVGKVSGADSIGGIAGVNHVSGVIADCKAEGELHGVHYVGGIAGTNHGVIRTSTNTAAVNTSAQQNEVDISDITIDNLTGTESAVTITDLGGIAGTNSGMIRDCTNAGSVGYRHMGYNLGGIAGSSTGYIAGCTNSGDIHGRKEAGGIVGQLEPSALVEYSTDTLQLLEAELSKLSGLLDRLSTNTQANTAKIKDLITAIRNHIANAESALDVLTLDLEEPKLESWDTYRAAIELLADSITGIDTAVRELASAIEATTEDLEADLSAVGAQMEAIEALLGGAEDNLGGTVSDVSDADTEEQFTSEVENCFNSGHILADFNAGGIVGAMALENDLDPESDVEVSGSASLNVAGQLRAVVRGCVSSGTVTVKNRNAGGIAGWQSMGLIRDCVSTCILLGDTASYLGGIAGRSAGIIRSCSAKCELSGKSFVGGIAGTGSTVTDCRSMAWITATEKAGMILGAAADSTASGQKLSGNLYTYTQQDLGAIDGISYAGLAQSVALEEFLELEGLEEIFGAVTLRFIFTDGTEQALSLTPGQMLAAEDVPELPVQAGFTGAWEGLEEAMQHRIVFDQTFRAMYTPCNTVISSDALRENGRCVLLLQGSFPAGTTVSVTAWNDVPVLTGQAAMSEVWKFTMPQGTVHQGRFLLPEGCDPERVQLQLYGTNGWREVEFSQQGSYLVFDLADGDSGIALVENEQTVPAGLIAAAAALAVTAMAVVIALCFRKRSGKKAQPQDGPDSTDSE